MTQRTNVKVNTSRCGFRGIADELARFILEKNSTKVLHKCAVVKKNIGHTERAES